MEPISGYLLLGLKHYQHPKKYSSSWNFGPNIRETLKVSELVRIFIKNLKIKSKIKIIYKNNKKFKESKLLRLNSSKAKKNLKWNNTWGMFKSIEETATWYENFLKGKNMKSYSKNQIDKYFN